MGCASINVWRKCLAAIPFVALAAAVVWAIVSVPGASARLPVPGWRPGSVPATSQTASAPTQPTQPAGITEAQFMRILQKSCVRCHKAFASMDGLKKGRWVVPGDAAASRIYKTIAGPKSQGKHKLSGADTKLIHDFIQNMPK